MLLRWSAAEQRSSERRTPPDGDRMRTVTAPLKSTKYVLARSGGATIEFFQVDWGPGSSVLPVFSSREAALEYLRACTPGQGWYVRPLSDGELVSLLFGPCVAVESVLLDPLPRALVPAEFLSRESFVDSCVGG